VNALVVTGGRVLTPTGWAIFDVFVDKGRIVPGAMSVRVGGETVDGASGSNEERRTGGAGAERAILAVTVEDHTATAAREATLAAGGAGGGRPDQAVTAAPGEGVATLDATGLHVVPGFVDLQCNGAYGIDLSSEPERLWDVAAALPRTGVTAWLPTIVSGPPDVRHRALATLRAGPPGRDSATSPVGPVAAPLGLHIEGPYLAVRQRGVHPTTALRAPDARDAAWREWSRDAGVALVTLAPELPGALDAVRQLVDRGVVVSAGHSSATAVEATAAIGAGVRWVTHLFNAMAPLNHREPGLAGVALSDERVRVGAIADGLHLHPTTVAVAARALGDRLTLVTDAVAAMGMPPGRVRLGAVEAFSGSDGVRLDDGTLAGSDLSLDRAVRNLDGFAGVGLAAAVTAATAAPSAVLGLADRGVIAPGAVGDLVLLDDAGTVVATVVGGQVAYDRRRPA